MHYLLDGETLSVVSSVDEKLLYYSEGVVALDVLPNENLVADNTEELAFISPNGVIILTNVLDYKVSNGIVYLVSSKKTFVTLTIFSDTFESLCTLYLVDGRYWVFTPQTWRLIIPVGLMIVVGFEDMCLYGYRNGSEYRYSLKKNAYFKPKKFVENIYELFSDKFKEER